ncbi:MAG TPA: DUF4238 domain-containing protein [Euryarchaeota archaeon]|nr:DUF4238 domain-containing protein [Euryarchaeota archaeon]
MSNPKKHHFVPRWHLEKFVDNKGFLHVLDKVKVAWRRQKPKEVMVVNQYYRQKWAPEGIDPNILEKSLGSKLEPEAKAAFDRLLAQAPDINDAETAAMLAYLELQRIRVPRQAEAAKQLLRRAIIKNSPPEVAKSIFDGKVNIDINDSFRFDFMRMVVGQMGVYFSRMEWEVVDAVEGSSFVITDSPVTYHNVDFFPPDEAGIALAGTKVFFPLSASRLLILRHPEYTIDGKVGASDKIPGPELTNGRIKVVFGRAWTEEQVNRANWIMMQLSDRYVAGCNKEILESMVGFSQE